MRAYTERDMDCYGGLWEDTRHRHSCGPRQVRNFKMRNLKPSFEMRFHFLWLCWLSQAKS